MLLLMAVAGFIALLLNPLVVLLQRVGVARRGYAVAIVTVFAVLVFAGLAYAFGVPARQRVDPPHLEAARAT